MATAISLIRSDEPFSCLVCGKKFEDKLTLYAHVVTPVCRANHQLVQANNDHG
jgi:hypothetical protein